MWRLAEAIMINVKNVLPLPNNKITEKKLQPKCICCDAHEVLYVGVIPPVINFAGRRLDFPLAGGSLFKCSKCGVAFRYPRLEKEKLDALYRLGNSENWQTASIARKDWQIACRWVNQHLPVGSSILDVGCFDGGFLKTFEKNYQSFGIEIHEVAGQKAQEAGIQVIGRDFASINEEESIFDAVTAFDVIEHTSNPLEFLKDMAKVTRDGGLVIVSTGNTDALTWKLLGSRYWYCSIGEHLSFISPDWCQRVGPTLGLKLKQVMRFTHANVSWKQRMSETVKNLFYAATPRGFSLLRRIGFGGDEFRLHKEMLIQPPSWMSAKDHFICIFEKNVP
jgi:2-polyprenyl-3-methyl-5-hydroxy-6-metoxy-1,4-benzoquinol methylase